MKVFVIYKLVYFVGCIIR